MASLDLERVKRISANKANLVYGFIRNVEKEQFKSDIIIPDLIICTCLLFWYCEEIFMPLDVDNRYLFLSKDRCSFHKLNVEGWNCSIFGKEAMSSHDNQVHIFDINVKKAIKDYNGIAVGIVSNKHSKSHYLPFFDFHCYGIFNSGAWGRIDGKSKSMEGIKYKEGDILTLIVDFEKKQIRGYKNERLAGMYIMFEDIKTGKDIQYKLAISLFHVGISISVNHHLQ